MNEETDNTEQRINDYYAAKRTGLRAPGQLWQQVGAKMAIGASVTRQRTMGRRWPAFGVSVLVAAALAAVLLYVAGPFGGGGGGPSAKDALAGSLDAIFDPQNIGLHSYSAVADVTNIGDNGEPTASRLKVWFDAPGKYRFEITDSADSRPFLFVANGTHFWAYDAKTNEYAAATREDLLLTQYFLMPIATGPNGEGAASMEDLLKSYSTGDQRLTLAGEDTVLGRPVYIVEISPAWHASSISGTNQTPVETSGGVMRFWIDKQTFFSLKLHADMGQDEPPFEINFTQYSANTPVDGSLFQFEPPAGATKVDGNTFFGPQRSTDKDSGAVATAEPITSQAVETPSR